MGNVPQNSTNAPYVSNVIAPIPQKQSQVKQIIKGHSSVIEDKAKKNFKTFKKSNVQFYGQIDPTTNQATGYGSIKKDGQLVFQGEFVNSLRNGYGIEYNKEKIIYEGSYINDFKDGWGKTNNYEGEFCRGKKQGWGIETDAAGRYEGYWKDDKEEGMGIKSYSYTIAENLFEFVSKQPIFSDTNTTVPCDIYIGEWKDGKRNGVGKFRNMRETYTGEFFDDFYHGQGTLITGSQTKKGVFEKGIFVG